MEPEKTRAIVDEVVALLSSSAGEQYFGEPVTKLEHALQCAWHAREARADEELILAALLHDIGHLLETPETVRDERVGVVNHDETGARWLLERGFSERLAKLVGGHVQAKRYLVSTNAEYFRRLSPASVETLRLQGGVLTEADTTAFSADPAHRDMLRLRSWDEMAKQTEWSGPGLDAYLDMMTRHLSGAGSDRAA